MRDSSVWAVMRLTPSFQVSRSVPSSDGYLWYCRKLLFSVVCTSVICAHHDTPSVAAASRRAKQTVPPSPQDTSVAFRRAAVVMLQGADNLNRHC